MLDYISGQIAELNPTFVVVDNNGIGYMINISLTTYNEVLKKSKGEIAKLYVYEAIREDAHVLFGFATKHERELFMMLISVSGVGPNTARMILSSLSPEDLEQCIASGNVGLLKSVKGIGGKTAQLRFFNAVLKNELLTLHVLSCAPLPTSGSLSDATRTSPSGSSCARSGWQPVPPAYRGTGYGPRRAGRRGR